MQLERVQVVHVHARISPPGAPRGRRHHGEPLAVRARARVRNRRAAGVRRARRTRRAPTRLLRLLQKRVSLFLASPRFLQRDRGEARFREVRLERLHHFPGLEIDHVRGAARGDGDEPSAVGREQ